MNNGQKRQSTGIRNHFYSITSYSRSLTSVLFLKAYPFFLQDRKVYSSDFLETCSHLAAKMELESPSRESRPRSDSQKRCLERTSWRSVVFFLSVLLAWCTSVSLAYIFVSQVVPSPSWDFVASKWNMLSEAVETQRSEATICGAIESQRCDTQLALDLSRISTKVQSANIRMTETIASAANITSTCSNVASSFLDEMLDIQIQGFAVTLNEQCTPQNASITSELLQLERFKRRRQTLSALVSFREAKANRDTILQNSVSARVAYDRSYAQNKTAALQSRVSSLGVGLQAALQPLNITFSEFDPLKDVDVQFDCLLLSANCSVGGGARGILTNVLSTSQSAIDDVSAALLQSALSAVNLYHDAKVILDAIEPIFNVIRDTGSAIGLDANMLPSLHLAPPNLPSAPNVSLPTFSELSMNFSTYLASFQKGFHDQITRFREDVGSSLHNLRSEVTVGISDLPVLLDDYNPPPINFSASAEANETETAISLASSMENSQSSPTLKPQAREFNISAPAMLEIKGQYPQFAPWTFPSKSASLISIYDTLYSLAVVIFVFDIVYRVLQTLRLILKHCKHTGTDEYVDLTSQPKDTISRCACNLVRSISGPVLVVAAILVLSAIILFYLVRAYAGAYEGYVEGCISSRNGTMLSSNVQSVSNKLVEETANAVTTSVHVRLDARRIQNCQQITSEEQQFLNIMSINQTFSRVEFNETARNVSIVADCVNWSNLAAQGARTRDGRDIRFAYIRALDACPSTLTSKSPFIFSFSPVSRQCLEDIPPCDVACVGASESVHRLSHDSSCHSEWFLHATVLRICLSLIVFISWNLSRLLLLEGLTRLLWAQVGARFIIQMAATAEGDLEGPITQDNISSGVDSKQKWMRIQAYLCLIGSLLVHAPYLYVIVLISDVQVPPAT